MSDIQEKIEQARQEAHAISEAKGATSPDAAAAWDVVEELQAEASHQRQQQSEAEPFFGQYCDENPDSPECLIYDD